MTVIFRKRYVQQKLILYKKEQTHRCYCEYMFYYLFERIVCWRKYYELNDSISIQYTASPLIF